MRKPCAASDNLASLHGETVDASVDLDDSSRRRDSRGNVVGQRGSPLYSGVPAQCAAVIVVSVL